MKRVLFILLISAGLYAQHGVNSVINRLQPKTVWHAYGGFENQNETIELTTGSWGIITNAGGDLWTATEYDGVTMSGDTMIFQYSGDYHGSLSITMSGANNDECYMRVYNVTQTAAEGYQIGFTGISATTFENVAMALYFEITANDSLVLQVMNTDSDEDIIVRSAIFYISYLHD